MRSLILKDLYNIGHNAKSMLFMLAVLAVVLIPTSGAPSYIIVSAILCRSEERRVGKECS